MKHRATTLIVAAILSVSAPVLAAPPENEDPRTLASEGMRQLIQAMELMLLAIPQYEAPIINENGDIIIRRKHPERGQQKHKPAPDQKRKDI